MSYAPRLADAVDPATLLLGRSEGQPELFLQGSREAAANRMTLPAGHARHLVDRCTLGLTQHCNHHVLLGGALRFGLRLRVRQHCDCRPQLIDQRVAVANFLSLFDAGQSVPQRQQPLAAERGSVQLLVRCNGNLAVIDCRRRPAAQRDSVVADDVDAHEWVLLIDPAAVPPCPTHALFAYQSQSIPDNVVALFGQIRAWNYSAEIARSAEVVRRAAGLKASLSKSNHCHPAGA